MTQTVMTSREYDSDYDDGRDTDDGYDEQEE